MSNSLRPWIGTHRAATSIASLAVLALQFSAFAEDAPQPAEPPTGPETAHRVIVPEAAPRLEAAFRRAAGAGWELKSASIDKVEVRAEVCFGAVCRTMLLGDPVAPCKGTVEGPWCVQWRPTEPPPGIPLASLISALSADPSETYWREIGARPAQPTGEATEPASPPGAATMAGATAEHHDEHPTAKEHEPAAEEHQQQPAEAEAKAAEGAHADPFVPLTGEALAKPEPMQAALSSQTSKVLLAGLLLLLGAMLAAVWWMRRPAEDQGRKGRKRSAGLIAYLWLGPHVVLGLWLALVPDTTVFATNQIVLLVHVALGLLMTPPIAWYSWVHIKKTWVAKTGPTLAGTIGKHGATVAVLGALLTGIVVLWSGEGMPAATVHLWFGVACAVALLLHLVTLTARQLTAITIGTAFGALVIGGMTYAIVPSETWAPSKPEFAYKERPLELYDSAEWCGSCHVDFYKEWKNSVHGSTFKGHDVQHEQRPLQAKGMFKFGLADVGKVVRGEPTGMGKADDPAAKFGTCSMCHTPTLYYGQGSEGPFGAEPPVSDAVTCSFCHTLRGVRDTELPIAVVNKEGPVTPDSLDLGKAFQLAPFYNSAPETVRRYIGQGSKDPVARWIGDLVINWRPEMHRKDYHSEFLDSSKVCQGCHGLGLDGTIHGTYVDWKASEFGKETEERGAVSCQDCHMAREMTGKPRSEPGRHVAWGPVRPRRTTHLFTGGNADWSSKYANQATADHQRKWNSKSIEVDVTNVVQSEHAVRVAIEVRTPLIGHDFPSMETVLRYGWAQISVFDGKGALIAKTYPWPGGHFAGPPPETKSNPKLVMGPLFYRSEGYPDDGSEDTVIPANGKRAVEVRLPLEPGSAEVKQVRVEVYNSWDKLPLATTVAEMPLASNKQRRHRTIGQTEP